MPFLDLVAVTVHSIAADFYNLVDGGFHKHSTWPGDEVDRENNWPRLAEHQIFGGVVLFGKGNDGTGVRFHSERLPLVQLTAEHVRDILSHSKWGFESSTAADGTSTYVGEKIDDPQKLKEIKQEKKNQNAKSCRAPPEKLVRSLAWALQGESPELAFPYLVLHRFCWKMLRAVKQECDPILRGEYTLAYMENETELPFVVGYILMANSGAGAEARDDRLLKAAAKVLNIFADTVGKFGVNLLGKNGSNIEFKENG